MPDTAFTVCTTHQRFHPCTLSAECAFSRAEGDVWNTCCHILATTPTQRLREIRDTVRGIRDADTCGIGDERPCPHGTPAGRYCPRCDA